MRPTYARLMKHWIRKYATAGLAECTSAALTLFGMEWHRDPRWHVHYNSRDLTPFREKVDRRQVRADLGIPENSLVVGHVGRFDPRKNHKFLVEIAGQLIRCQPNARVLLVGEGPLLDDVKRQVNSLGLENYFVFTGVRADVPRLMLGAMDCFILPSLYEGLPGVAIEAQAAGLPLLMSDEVTTEVIIPQTITERLSLSRAPAVWANTLVRLCNGPRMSQPDAVAAVSDSPFNVDRAHYTLEELYRRQSATQTTQLMTQAAVA